MSLLNPINLYDPKDPALKNLTDAQRFRLSLLQGIIYLAACILAIIICAFIGSCSTPKTIEEHHHHYYEADTMAVHAQVDRQLTSWHEEMTQFFTERLEQFSSQMQQSEHQQETISELITVSTDSVGRSIRQEQRTITRDISRELQQQEQRITQEMQAQLRVVVDSVNDAWQSRYDSLAAHVSQMDSTLSIIHQPSAIDHRPWYQRWWDNLRTVLIGIVIAAVAWSTRRWWAKWF